MGGREERGSPYLGVAAEHVLMRDPDVVKLHPAIVDSVQTHLGTEVALREGGREGRREGGREGEKKRVREIGRRGEGEGGREGGREGGHVPMCTPGMGR